MSVAVRVLLQLVCVPTIAMEVDQEEAPEGRVLI
jgi:hypothetical protein